MSREPAPAAAAGVKRLRGEPRPEFLKDELLHEMLQAAADAYPDRVAVRSGNEELTYRELVGRSSRVARHLRTLGVGRGARVVLRMSRGPEMYVAMLGILQAGAAYVPTDPDWPAERVRFIAEDASAACAIVDGALDGEAMPCRVIRFAAEPGFAGAASLLTRAETSLGPDDGAYIIYTSGSTGRPKGVMISHRSICHFVRAEGAVLGLRQDDLVFQGASLSFDMSLEEIWPAWAAGATLLVGTREMLRAGGDLATLLARAGVTVWTGVPTLVAMQDAQIPTLRLLNLGGEACPPDLVRKWARPGLRIINTYGPTETTITATWAELTPDRPVTIGQPLPNYTAYIVSEGNDDGPDDGSGELWVGGPGVALGYVERPDLTAERFVANRFTATADSTDPLLYRTGDRVRLTSDGDLEFLGRIDTQVKIRGFRVELSEIESVLLAVDGLKQAAVAVQPGSDGSETLVAYVVPRPGGRCDEALLRTRLKERLPAYMVPAVFEPLASLPMLTSGKVDRKSLPSLTRPRARMRTTVPPSTPTEQCIHGLCTGLFATADVSIDDDFFLDLGGHSLRAAALVSSLRKHPGLRHVSMGDVYNCPTVRSLAAHLDATRPKPKKEASVEPHATVPRSRYIACAIGQGIGLVFVYGLFSLQWLIPYLSYAWLYNQEDLARPAAIAISISLFLIAIPIMLAVGIAAKWLILGRLKPGEYPLWGFTYYRWWLTQRLLDTVPTNYLGGSPLLGLYYRLLGARIGRGVLLDGVPIDAPDCVTIGDDTSVAAGAVLAACRVEGGRLKVGTIHIGRDCFIGASSVVAMNATIGSGAELDDLSMLAARGTIPTGECWSGSPAQRSRAVRRANTTRASNRRRRSFGGLYFILLLLFPVFAVLPILPGMVLMTELDQNSDAYSFMLLSPLLAIVFVGSMCLQIAALKWLLIGRVKPGQIPVFSLRYVRHWLVDQLMQLSLDVVNPLYASLYLNPWYRLLGVKLGPRAEVSTASSISYDLLEVGAESFVADAVSLGAPRIDRGTLTLGKTAIGRRAFVGNSAVIPAGTTLGDGVLIGVLSVPPRDSAEAARMESSWFGSPAVFLPQRQIATQFGEGSTFRPKRRLIAQRLTIEFFRIILPLTVMIALTSLLMSYVVDMDDAGWPVTAIVLAFPLLYIGYALAVGAIVLVVKWTVIGRYRSVEKPLWNQFVWRSELVTSTYENLAVPLFADLLRGTPFLSAYLRLLGCRIGKRVYLDTTDLTEFDLVRIGDDAALNHDSGPQTHLFEDRVMKISAVDIGPRCVIGAGSIVLYDARMESDSTLGELSMLMKGETLPAGTRWEGSPARPCS